MGQAKGRLSSFAHGRRNRGSRGRFFDLHPLGAIRGAVCEGATGVRLGPLSASPTAETERRLPWSSLASVGGDAERTRVCARGNWRAPQGRG